MRKVITGEQIAQLTNPDPFAVPDLAGTGLPHPRLDHHPRPAGPVPGLAGPADRPAPGDRRGPCRAGADLAECGLARPGRPGRLVLAVLGVWRWVRPVSFSRWIAEPGAGQVAGLVVLPAPLGRGADRRWPGPCYQGRLLLPVLGKVSSTRYTDRVAVRLVSGQSAGRFRGSGGQSGARVRGHVVPGPHRPVGGGAAGVRPPRRPGRDRPGPARPGTPGSAGAAGRQTGGRAAVAGPAAWHASADRGRDRGGQGLAAVGR